MARKNEVEIQTRLGLRLVNLDKVIYFPRGLAGFEGLHEFILLQMRPDAPFLILQSIDNPSVGLLVCDPFSFLRDYKIKIGDAEEKLLRIRTREQVTVLVTVSVPEGKPEETSLNLVGPIVVNHEMRLGLQIPQADNANLGQYFIHKDVCVSKKDSIEAAANKHEKVAESPKSNDDDKSL